VGPEGANFTALAADPTSLGTVYAGAYYGGVWKSSDGAKTWQNISQSISGSLKTDTIYDIEVSSLSGTVYVGWGGAPVIYKSVDRGAYWTTITLPTQKSPNGTYAVSLDPMTDNNLYAFTRQSEVFASQDGGATWSQLSTPCGGPFVADPKTEGTLYCIGSAGFLASNDAGQTWSTRSPLIVSEGVTLNPEEFVVAPSDPKYIYLVDEFPEENVANLYSSTDGGATWTQALSSVYFLSHIVVSPTTPLSVFVTTFGNKLLSSADGGNTWVASSPVPLGGGAGLLTMLPGSPTVLIGNWGTHLWSTADGGGTWSDAGQGAGALFGFQMAVDAESPQNVYFAASNGGGLYKSPNSASTWNNTLIAGSCTSISVDPFDSNHVLAGCSAGEDPQPPGNDSLLVSSDGGATWQGINSTLTVISTIEFDPNFSGVVYVGGILYSGSSFGPGILKSSDGGASWALIDNGFPSQGYVYSFAVDPSNSDLLLAGIVGSAIYKSADGGASWTMKSSAEANSIAFDPNHEGNVYASGNNAYKSTDHGETWSQLNLGRSDLGAPLELAVDPKSADTVFLIPYNGPAVGWSPDGGETWFWLSNGLAPLLPIGGNYTSAAIAATTPEVLFISAPYEGVVSLVLQH
jgi:photosystem II stability/assembly factor-like uncharacterized protein